MHNLYIKMTEAKRQKENFFALSTFSLTVWGILQAENNLSLTPEFDRKFPKIFTGIWEEENNVPEWISIITWT